MSEKTPRYRTILLFGMPGSGKGTQGAVLDKLPFFVHVSMGEVLRKLPKHSKLGNQIVQITSKGNMVPDDLVVEVYSRYTENLENQDLLTKNQHILILDGIPRNSQQARILSSKLDVLQIFHLVIRDTDVAKERLRGRALREGRLDDMHEDVINRRFRTYYEETYETLKFYDPSIVQEVEASSTPLHVLQKIVNRLVELPQVQNTIAGTLALGVRLTDEPGAYGSEPTDDRPDGEDDQASSDDSTDQGNSQ